MTPAVFSDAVCDSCGFQVSLRSYKAGRCAECGAGPDSWRGDYLGDGPDGEQIDPRRIARRMGDYL